MLFGSSGIRRLYDQEFLRLAQQVGAIIGLHADTIVVGRDSRSTGQLLVDAFASGACSSGSDLLLGGIAPTPSVAYSSRSAKAGCMVTASHNPEPYNGLKLFNPDGSSFSAIQQDKIEEDLSDIRWQSWEHQGTIQPWSVTHPHRDAILEKIRIPDGLKVIVDCGNGAGSMLTPDMLSSGGATVISVNADPSGIFSRPSEPLEENLPYIPSLIKKTGARCAVVHDGDADRMMGFDEKGRYIPGDILLILFARYLGAQKIVTTYDASMAVEEDAEVRRTPVGDAYVSEQLVRWGDFGGEPSGAWIFPQISFCPDGPYAAALFCEMAGEWNIAEQVDTIPRYPIMRRSIQTPEYLEILYRIGATNPTDGIRIEEDDGWCLIRASGTEPKIRFTAEGKTIEIATKLLEKGEDMVRLAKGGLR